MSENTFISRKTALLLALFGLLFGFLAGAGINVDLPDVKDQNQSIEKQKEETKTYEPQLTHEEMVIETTESAIKGVVAIETTDETVAGSGFFISKDGYILTNRHVVSSTNSDYYVVTHDGERLESEVVDKDPLRDLAFLKVEGEDFHILDLGDSNELRLGQTAIAIGYSLGELKNSVSVGVVSGLVRDIWARSGWDVEKLKGMIQTDAAVNPGNSGGPLLNLKGEVIGVNIAKSSQGDNVGFAMPVNKIKSPINSILEEGKIVNPFLGVHYVTITEYEAKMRGLPIEKGALIVRGGSDLPAVTPDSPANEAGFREGDIITKFDGKEITPENPLYEIILEYSPGEEVKIEYMRGSQTHTTTVELAERPSD